MASPLMHKLKDLLKWQCKNKQKVDGDLIHTVKINRDREDKQRHRWGEDMKGAPGGGKDSRVWCE